MSANLRRLGGSDLAVSPFVLGTNVFGWTADERDSFAVLNAYVDAGGNMLDTADSYYFKAPGNVGGESETIIGRWLARTGRRDDVLLATKVSQHPKYKGLAPGTIRAAVEESLRRLHTDRIDLYYAHFDDPTTPLEDTVAAMSALIDAGKVRHLAISNYNVDRARAWLSATEAVDGHRIVAIQPQYSLMERSIESDILPLAQQEGLGVVTYYSLAHGFLTGKYRANATVDSPRADAAAAYLDARGQRLLHVVEEVAAAHSVSMTAIALAWLAGRPGVTAPIASARNDRQLAGLLEAAHVTLNDDESALLDEASATVAAGG